MKQFLNTKLLGGTLLLTGTAMGGGLLALPLATAKAGFLNSFALLISTWLLMTTSALLTLEISLWLPPNTNIISITRTFLNREATLLAWSSYLLLLYSLVAAYVAVGADLLTSFIPYLSSKGVYFRAVSAILFTSVLGSIVYQGINWVDYFNRILMFFKLTLYSLMVATILPYISVEKLTGGEIQHVTKGFGVLITSFAYANVIPSLRTYFGEKIADLRKAILMGSTIPLICYTLWNASVTGTIPLYGELGLIKISQMNGSTTQLIKQLNQLLNNRFITILSNSFAYVCVLTTFLTCSLGLSDFIADGLKLTKKKTKTDDLFIYGITFIPPLLIALVFPEIFVTALNYAGIYCLILFVLLPVLIAWQGRYRTPQKFTTIYQLPGGKSTLICLGTIGITSMLYTLYHIFNSLIK